VIVYGQWPTLTLERARELHIDAKRMLATVSEPVAYGNDGGYGAYVRGAAFYPLAVCLRTSA
jgi:hypothetical protein